METSQSTWERWATLLAVVSSAAAILFAALNSWQAQHQLALTVDQARADQVSSFAGLSADCTEGHVDGPRPVPTDTLDLWQSLCGARRLATEIIINDLLVTDKDEQPLVNRTASRHLSIDLEDGLVREVLSVARSVEQAVQEGSMSQEDVCRSRHLLASVYLLPHAKTDTEVEHELMGAIHEEMDIEVAEHLQDLENATNLVEKAHAERFLELAKLLEKFGRPCRPVQATED